MKEEQIRGPLQLLGRLILRENTSTLVIHGKDRTIARIPFGFAIIAGVVLVLTMPPMVIVVGCLALYSDGGSITVERPTRAVPPAQGTRT